MHLGNKVTKPAQQMQKSLTQNANSKRTLQRTATNSTAIISRTYNQVKKTNTQSNIVLSIVA